MSDLLSIAMVIAVVTILFGPLLLLGFLALADTLDWPIAARILDVLFIALTAQFVIGGLVNVVLGIALVGGSIWVAQHGDAGWRWLVAALVLVLGVWRIWRGGMVLWGCYEESS